MLCLYLRTSSDSRADAHALLDAVLSRDFGVTASVVLRSRGEKPRLASGPQFNLSHSGPYALCGVGDRPVGVDVEAVRPRRETLPRYVLSDEEWDWYRARGSRWEDFYLLWTLKESLVKYTGQGLDRAPRTLRVPLLNIGESALLDGLWFRSYGGDGWRAACCCEEPPPALLTEAPSPCPPEQ